MEVHDVVIVGGAVTGSSTAYHLAADPDFKGRVLVIEKDPELPVLRLGAVGGLHSPAILDRDQRGHLPLWDRVPADHR